MGLRQERNQLNISGDELIVTWCCT